jgi:hypothetical protein
VLKGKLGATLTGTILKKTWTKDLITYLNGVLIRLALEGRALEAISDTQD